MHKEFLKLLEKATGRSEDVIAINLDIRSFTPFCKTVDSLRVATYITRVYLKIIKDYFKNASYYKPTGDGLIIIIPYKRENLHEVANLTIESCLKLLQDFSSLCIGDPMINYPTPQKIGIGVARGSACCIISEDKSKVLDYSGRLLNLASRLMELARPSGIVFDDSFQINILKDETKELFEEKTGYIRGVAEEKTIKIHCTKKYTLIPDSFSQPLKEPKWQTDTHNFQYRMLKKIPTKEFRLFLSRKPLDEGKISVYFAHGHPEALELDIIYDYTIEDDEIGHERVGNRFAILLDIHTINDKMEKKGILEDMNVRIEIVYPVK